jgi:lactoylglutathione lyase
LSFYGPQFELSLRGRGAKIAFIDLGDQFINLSESRAQGPDEERHFGLVVDDKEKVRRRLKQAGVKTLSLRIGRSRPTLEAPPLRRYTERHRAS